MLDSPEIREFQGKKEIIQSALGMHDYYDRVFCADPLSQVQVNGHKEALSYHNRFHAQAGVKAATAFVRDVIKGGHDVFGLRDQFRAWQESPNNIDFNFPSTEDYLERIGAKENLRLAKELDFNTDFETAVAIAFACHDLGNITKGWEKHNNDTILDQFLKHKREVYADTYQEGNGGSEEYRGGVVAGKLIDRFMANNPKRDAYKLLVGYLIEQTFFDLYLSGTKKPLGNFMQIIDQVGSAYFEPREYSILLAGLFNEQRRQEKKPKMDLDQSLEFPISRLADIIDNQIIRKSIQMKLEELSQRNEAYFKLSDEEKQEFGQSFAFEKAIPILFQRGWRRINAN